MQTHMTTLLLASSRALLHTHVIIAGLKFIPRNNYSHVEDSPGTRLQSSQCSLMRTGKGINACGREPVRVYTWVYIYTRTIILDV